MAPPRRLVRCSRGSQTNPSGTILSSNGMGIGGSIGTLAIVHTGATKYVAIDATA
jgi:hypothetical protein